MTKCIHPAKNIYPLQLNFTRFDKVHQVNWETSIPFVWSEPCQHTFEEVTCYLKCFRKCLCTFHWEKEFFLWTDASLVDLGLSLNKVQVIEWAPVAYASHAMTAAEQKYNISELEVVALVHAQEHFE